MIDQEVEFLLATRWQWPVNLDKYDRSPELTEDELVELDLVWQRFQVKKSMRRRQETFLRLHRLLEPICDVLDIIGADEYQRTCTMNLMMRDMGRTRKAFWAWTTEDWAAALQDSTYFQKRMNQFRFYVVAVAYLLCDFVDFRALPNFNIAGLATKVFGLDLLTQAVGQLRQELHDFGYDYGTSSLPRRLTLVTSYILLTNRSPYVEDITAELLTHLYRVEEPQRNNRYHIRRISRVLHKLGMISHPVRPDQRGCRVGVSPERKPRPAPKADKPFRYKSQIGQGRIRQSGQARLLDGIAPEWVRWCERWRDTSTLAEKTRRHRYYQLLKTGRWLAAMHPDIVSPDQWTRELAAEYVAAVDRMKAGEWGVLEFPQNEGKELSPSSKARIYAEMRRFFLDCQQWGWIRGRFDPTRSLATPASIKSQVHLNPRIIADDVWAKLLYAGLTLTEDDLPKLGAGVNKPQYPLEMVRALLMVWFFAGLRPNEMRRLPVGCVRWQADEGAAPAENRICLLDVPVSKNNAAYTKPVDGIVGETVEVWEKARLSQAPLPDPKTGDLVHFLFMYRGQWINKDYLNRYLIPVLCDKAGVPLFDEHGAITCQRARPTIASQLFNARDPMSFFELQAWLGHVSPNSTRYYVQISPTHLANSYRDAGYFGRNLRTIEVLIDQEAVRTGAVAQGIPWKYYDLGHGYCTYEFFDQCPHRMACAKCPFYRPKESTEIQLLEARSNLQRMLQEIPLTDDERAAVEDGIQAVGNLAAQLVDVPTPAGPTPRQLQSQNVRGASAFIPISEID